jgi:hypothetical protein
MNRTPSRHGYDRSRDGGTSHAGASVTRYGHIPDDRQACNRRRSKGLDCLMHSPCNRWGGVATLPHHLIRIALRVSSTGSSDRQRAGVNPLRYRLSAAFIPLRVLGRSYQSRLVQHVTRQCPDAHEGHTRTSFQSRCSDNQEHEVKGLAVGQAIFGEKQNAFG